MRAFWRAMKTAAYMRHTALVLVLHGHNREAMQRAMLAHMRFVDLVYAPFGV